MGRQAQRHPPQAQPALEQHQRRQQRPPPGPQPAPRPIAPLPRAARLDLTRPRPSAPDTFGTTRVSYAVVDASELNPIESSVHYTYAGDAYSLRYGTNTPFRYFSAPLHLPSGVKFGYSDVYGKSVYLGGRRIIKKKNCGKDGQDCTPQLGPASCGDDVATLCSGNVETNGLFQSHDDLTGNGIVIDNAGHGYRVTAGTSTTDGSTAFGQIIVGYVLQVSPAPPAATFGDVPMTHPFFRYVEALAASGVSRDRTPTLRCQVLDERRPTAPRPAIT